MGKMIVHECCCGCSLRSGTITIGVYNTVQGLIGLIIYYVIAFSDNSDHHRRSIYIISAVICTLEFFASICLTYGAIKKKKRFISPWLVITTFLVVSYFVVININLFLVFAAGTSMAFSLSGFISIALTIYFLIVVYSYHESFNASNNNDGQVITYTVEDHHYPGQPMVVVPTQDFYPQNFSQPGYPQPLPQGYPQHLQPAYLQEYQLQPPPYESSGTYAAGPPAPVQWIQEHKQQP